MLWTLALILVVALRPAAAAELEADAHTLLLLHFNDNLVDTAGLEPAVARGVAFEPGLFGAGCRLHRSDSPVEGDSLYYPLPSGFDPREGTVEFWLKPRWIGRDFYVLQAFNIGELRAQINVPGILAFFMLEPENEVGYLDVQGWQESDWHHVAVTWKIPGRQRLYVDGVLRMDNPATEVDLLGELPEYVRLGATFPSENVEAVLDEFRLSSRERTHQEIAETVMAAPMTVSGVELSLEAIRLQPGWHFTPELVASTDLGPDYLPNPVATWVSSDPSVARVDAVGKVTAYASGSAQLTVTFGAYEMAASVTVDDLPLPPEKVPVDSFLGRPAAASLFEIPVVIIAYLPSLDGVHAEHPDPGGVISLEEARQRVTMFSRRVKFAAEEGSRFRGYRDPTAVPSLGYRVVDVIYVYEHMPLSDNQVWWNPANQYPEYHQVLERFGGRQYVEEQGVKEFWIWYAGYTFNGIGFELPESNMSSPVTGDISNSARLANDLPVYEHTYIVYQFGWHLNHAYAIHNIGHQLESMMSHANQLQDGDDDLFVHRYCGMDDTETWITGRCGWTHMPPNTADHYVYDDPTPVLSDCEDWTPDGSGERQWVEVSTWRDLPYSWPPEPSGWTPDDSPYHVSWQRAESHFYIYWRQNWPGHHNGIELRENQVLTNWWAIVADWDRAMTDGIGLYERRVPTAVAMPDDAPAVAASLTVYPNPFNGTAQIAFSLRETGHVQMRIYNVAGQELRQLTSVMLPSGTHRLVWDGRDGQGQAVASGQYYVRQEVHSGERVQVRTAGVRLVR